MGGTTIDQAEKCEKCKKIERNKEVKHMVTRENMSAAGRHLKYPSGSIHRHVTFSICFFPCFI